jgi:hypothetical protein
VTYQDGGVEETLARELVRTDQVAIDETVAAYPAFKNADRSTLCFGPSTAAPVEPTFWKTPSSSTPSW